MAPVLFRIAHHNPHLVAPPLQPHRLGAVKGASQLTAKVFLGDAQGAGFTAEPKFEFLLASRVTAGDIINSGIVANGGLKPIRGWGEHGKVLMGQLNIDIGSHLYQVGGKGQGINTGKFPDQGAPAASDLGSAYFPLFTGSQEHSDGR